MDLFVTYCSADKDTQSEPLPAIQRYRSVRIQAVRDAAILLGTEFRILSGRHGLLAGDEPVLWYDHLLTETEVLDHAVRVTGQIEALQPQRVFYFCRPLVDDPAAGPYRDSLTAACRAAGLRRILIEIPNGDPTATLLVDLFRQVS